MEQSIVEKLLTNIDNLHELGRQRALELGNPFHYQREEDGDLYRKEMPTGELFLVKVEIVMDENGTLIEIKDTIIKRLN